MTFYSHPIKRLYTEITSDIWFQRVDAVITVKPDPLRNNSSDRRHIVVGTIDT